LIGALVAKELEIQQVLYTDANRNQLGLRPISTADTDFLFRVYASTRLEELALLDWKDAQKEAFLKMQFEAQHTYYMEQFPHAGFNILVYDGIDVGRLYLDLKTDEIRIIDIALLSKFRNQGLGTICMNAILEMGQGIGVPVRIHVEQNNRALIWYRRLGFQKISENGIYFLMEKQPGFDHGGLHA
jgi:ribosomal protein S18 acetylase RimI-like enzyme